MDIDTIGLLFETDSCRGYGEVSVNTAVLRQNTTYHIFLSIDEKYSLGDVEKDESFATFFTPEDAREIGERLVFLADLAEKANLETDK
jgi:hypothetical protein